MMKNTYTKTKLNIWKQRILLLKVKINVLYNLGLAHIIYTKKSFLNYFINVKT